MGLPCKVHLTNGFEMRRWIGEEKLNWTADVDEKINWYCPVASSLTLAKLQIWKFSMANLDWTQNQIWIQIAPLHFSLALSISKDVWLRLWWEWLCSEQNWNHIKAAEFCRSENGNCRKMGNCSIAIIESQICNSFHGWMFPLTN